MGMAQFPGWEAETQRGQDPHPPIQASLHLIPTCNRPEVNPSQRSEQIPRE